LCVLCALIFSFREKIIFGHTNAGIFSL
jgi:hypothetical protein